MCMEDIRIGRKAGSSTNVVLVGTSATLIAAADPHRISLIITAPATARNFVSTLSDVVAGQGIVMQFNTVPLKLNIRDDGQLVTKAWYALNDTTPQNICVMQSRLDVE